MMVLPEASLESKHQPAKRAMRCTPGSNICFCPLFSVTSNRLSASNWGYSRAAPRARRGGRPLGFDSDMVSTLAEVSCKSDRMWILSPVRCSLPQKPIATVSNARWRLEDTRIDRPSVPRRILRLFSVSSPFLSAISLPSTTARSDLACAVPSTLSGESRNTDPPEGVWMASLIRAFAMRNGIISSLSAMGPLLKTSFHVDSQCRTKTMLTLSVLWLMRRSGSGALLMVLAPRDSVERQACANALQN
mmetsp:Transcript_42232/g.105550  ORF Transcript_42232/g.105550 Transcript_42232/m.105550 type:complete len:247 (-) Transcript_42232:180-920(-)